MGEVAVNGQSNNYNSDTFETKVIDIDLTHTFSSNSVLKSVGYERGKSHSLSHFFR